MSCCAKKRNEYVGDVNYHSQTFLEPAKMREDIYFEYTGQTALSVTGMITGNKYRFSKTGEVQQIDHRDAGSMMAVPVLKKVKIMEVG